MYTPIRYLLLDNTSKLAFTAALAPHSISLGQSIFWGCFQLGPVYSINRKSLLFALLNGALGLPRFLLFCIIRLPAHKASPITFWPFFSFDCCFPCCCCLLVLSWEREIKWNYFSRRQIYWLTFECGFSTDSCFETKRRKKSDYEENSPLRHYRHHRPKRAPDAWLVANVPLILSSPTPGYT